MAVPSRWDTLLTLLKRSQFLYGPGLSLMRENVRKMWYSIMFTVFSQYFGNMALTHEVENYRGVLLKVGNILQLFN